MISTSVKFSKSQKARQDKKKRSLFIHIYHPQAKTIDGLYLKDLSLQMISYWLEKLKHCPLGAYFVLIFCHYLFHWDIFLYFIFNILWFWKSRTWSESFFWYCISRVLANTWGIIWMANTIDIQHRTLAWKKKMLCQVTFKYNQLMI